ncbi:L-histidine N(alpha)-methyltransferase [Olivibacter sp. XZL3]|uniref:L-histidine N(alpha)-methyltransferase n=1 Tax=Olivibacter sp. XZL3 TaxID=1735116 RepID=UPI0010669308|nr:L-histidine N(alpha)-methyltransferase [Olivibacter sp. XZL3]
MNTQLFYSVGEMTDITNTTTALFCKDVMEGLQSTPKHLDSKYFYDAKGDQLFLEIMNCPEYYLTNAELEIFSEKTHELVETIAQGDRFDLIELGAGDAMKSTYLLQALLEQQIDFHYVPIDISRNVIDNLSKRLPKVLPSLQITGLNGEYFDMLEQATSLSPNRKVVLFLGSNIGNMPLHEAMAFCKKLRGYLSKNDLLLMGMDLKKNPKTILAAYDDKEGITKRFNLNLLERINRELGGNFIISQFDHYATYDPESGACKSYLISLTDQSVQIGETAISFAKDEYIFMEISQKFSFEQIDALASASGFQPVGQLFDSRKWFTDVIWTVN